MQAPRLTMVLYEVGGWDRDTFAVESAGFNDKTPLDAMGHPHSDQLRVVQRFRRCVHWGNEALA